MTTTAVWRRITDAVDKLANQTPKAIRRLRLE
jgi:hypothetical protein